MKSPSKSIRDESMRSYMRYSERKEKSIATNYVNSDNLISPFKLTDNLTS